MPLEGEHEPSKAQFVRDQVELYESSGGTQGTTLSVLAHDHRSGLTATDIYRST
jgi:hypothetical protein